jgi:hypothetical protein
MSRYPSKSQIGRWASFFLLLLALADQALAADRYLIASATLQSSSIPKSLMEKVNPKGWVLYTQSYNVREEICEIFVANEVTEKAVPSGSAKAPYSDLKEGTFVGVIHLLPEATEDYSADSHSQTLKPGYYTLRYAVMAAGTYENGTKPGDFLVLSPVSLDQDPNRILTTAELSRFGSAASGSDVPATMELISPDSNSGQVPSVKIDETNMAIFQLQLPLASKNGHSAAELPLAIGLVTPLHGPEGS